VKGDREQFVVIDEDDDLGETPVTWRFDRAFLTSNWSCIWGRGCQGILDRLAPELNPGCCSEGAALVDDFDAMDVAANAASIPQGRWQHATVDPLERRDDGRWYTKVVDGACVFHNRPGYDGGEGCALHLAAVDFGERPLDWKPNVCWQMPLKVDESRTVDGRIIRTVRAWSKADWGPEAELAWFCTESQSGAFVGDHSVLVTMHDELIELVSEDVYRRLVSALMPHSR
jgi:hypothetical protein